MFVFGGCSAKGRLADLYEFDTTTGAWIDYGTAPNLRGRGGANLIALLPSKKLAVIAGFAGEETNDGAIFDLETKSWNSSLLVEELKDMRPRSVCVNGAFSGSAIVFGGEVDPSALGHEGAGGFANDVVVLDAATGHYVDTIPAASDDTDSWPETRGWSAAAATTTVDGKDCMYIFGGLSGDDSNPKRLNDLWQLTID
uniref:Uncharacterized protein n=1 Tax=Grammatophora oceanica TaxID=210454 RepID=A0A7S1UZP4_9STRA